MADLRLQVKIEQPNTVLEAVKVGRVIYNAPGDFETFKDFLKFGKNIEVLLVGSDFGNKFLFK